ncbi:MAG TPA: DNA repair exonuclease [Candidatus Dormibacteraeota bacterium]
MTYRLLHTADLHLDRAFAGRGCNGDLARQRRAGLRQALQLMGERAWTEQCQAVSIAGDLYEHERSGVDTERFLQATFEAWRPIQVFIAPGNHDALLPGSLYRRVDWPPNVHIFTEPRLTAVSIDEGLTLWGLGHREPSWMGNPLDGDVSRAGGGVHLALFHGAEMASRPDGKGIHGPFRVEQIRERGFAMALCGHYHRRRIDHQSGLVYAGSPEPLTFDETGGRGPVLVEVENNGAVKCTAIDSNSWTAVTASCDVSSCSSTSGVTEAAAHACRVATPAAERMLFRLDLTGTIDCRLSIDAPFVESELRERTGFALVQVRDCTTPAINLEAAARERSTRGAFVRSIQAARAQADAEEQAVLDDALRYGLEALAGAEVGLR